MIWKKFLILQKKKIDRNKKFGTIFKTGLPNKKDENWKFSDLNTIISKNFKNISNNDNFKLDKKIQLINNFEHNYIVLINGSFKSSDIKFEDKGKS